MIDMSDKSIKICMASAYFATMKGGGEHYTLHISNCLADLGYDITIVCGRRPFKKPEPLSKRFEIDYIPQLYFLRDWGMKRIKLISGGAGLVHSYQYMLSCYRHMIKSISNYNIIITHDPASLRAAIKAKQRKEVPILSIFHGPISKQLARKLNMKSINAFISGGSSVPEDDFLKYGAEKVFTVYSGVDTDVFKPSNKDKMELKKELDLPVGKKIIIYVGRLIPSKNVDSLLKASKILSHEIDVHLLIIGDGALKNRLERVTSKLNISNSTTFLGAIPYERLPLFYSAADVFVIPNSIGSFPLVTLEAIACGCPVVTSIYSEDVLREFPEVIGVSDPRDPSAIADAVKTVLEDEELSGEMRQSGLKEVHKHSWKNRAEHVDEILKSLITG